MQTCKDKLYYTTFKSMPVMYPQVFWASAQYIVNFNSTCVYRPKAPHYILKCFVIRAA